VIDLARLKSLIDLAASSPLGELEVVEEGFRVAIRRASSPSPGRVAEMRAEQSVALVPAPGVAMASRPAVPPPPGVAVVASPMYGIFHRAPAPGAAPFVEAGTRVRRGDTLCLIEAMKVFNAVEAVADGTVAEVLAGNGDEVELDQALFRIAP
jgi:acetyl-CoA carboxylase biotin carboxyl carrier protein